ncbi:MAG: hypothetical protein N2109_04835 [Fimbriimonadales bacterium]|nr:hypothetical protein [Fimbriimonadales bacterium]
MPFEPLRTDEKLDHEAERPRDMDTHMIAGCSGFVATSLLTYFLALWPHLVFHEGYRLATLAAGLGFGLVPACILGAVATRRFGLPGACGFLGGVMAFSVFLHLRIQQFLAARGSRDLPQPEYPDDFQWMVPLLALALAVLAAAASLPRSERP